MSLVLTKLKLLSYVINSASILDTVISVGRLFHNVDRCIRNFNKHNRFEVEEGSASFHLFLIYKLTCIITKDEFS